jgi:hypothetical protein
MAPRLKLLVIVPVLEMPPEKLDPNATPIAGAEFAASMLLFEIPPEKPPNLVTLMPARPAAMEPEFWIPPENEANLSTLMPVSDV